MNILSCIGRFAQAGNVPVQLTAQEAKDTLGRYNETIYTFASRWTPDPGADEGALHVFDHQQIIEDQSHGLTWSWPELHHYAQEMQGGPAWRGSDFYTAWAKINRDARRFYPPRVHGRTHYYKFVPADVIRVPAQAPVPAAERFELYEMTDGKFVFLERLYETATT